MKIYISGPITGKANYEQSFDDAEDMLYHAHFIHHGACEVINPTKLPIPVKEWTSGMVIPWIEWMRYDIKHLVDCDAIYMLPGWVWSRGARVERVIAWMLGIKRIRVKKWGALPIIL